MTFLERFCEQSGIHVCGRILIGALLASTGFALFLASKASQFVNGHILYVDGGILANFGYVKGENEIKEMV